jgi:hypothetical protein
MYPLTVLGDSPQLRPIARHVIPSARFSLSTSLSIRMDSLSAAIAHLLDGGGVVGALPSAVNVPVGLSAGRYSHVPG